MKISHEQALQCVEIVQHLATNALERHANAMFIPPEVTEQIKAVWKEIEGAQEKP